MTPFERQLEKSGCQIITWDHDIIADYLLRVLDRDYEELFKKAIRDKSRRKYLVFILDYDQIDYPVNFGGTVHFSKKKKTFTHIQYSDSRNFAVDISISSKVSFHSYDFYADMKKNLGGLFPTKDRIMKWLSQ